MAMKDIRFIVLSDITTVLAGMFVISSLQEIMAQETNNTAQSNQTRMGIPQLNGSVNIVEQSNQFIQDSIQVPFATALETAQSEVGNGTTTAISGRLGIVQGYLVYIVKVANFDSETSRTVVVDAGNGAVLHTSGDMPLYLEDLGCEGGHHHKGFGSHGGIRESGSGRLDRSNSEDQSLSGRVVASPAIGV